MRAIARLALERPGLTFVILTVVLCETMIQLAGSLPAETIWIWPWLLRGFTLLGMLAGLALLKVSASISARCTAETITRIIRRRGGVEGCPGDPAQAAQTRARLGQSR